MNELNTGLNITKNTTDSKCEDCSMCCHHHNFDDIEYTDNPNNPLWRKAYLKKPFDWCTYCSTHKSCDIWKDRPTECMDFKCMYLEYDMDDEWYPKNAGFFVEVWPVNGVWDKSKSEEEQIDVAYIWTESKNEHKIFNVDPYKTFFNEKMTKYHWSIILITEKGQFFYNSLHKRIPTNYKVGDTIRAPI